MSEQTFFIYLKKLTMRQNSHSRFNIWKKNIRLHRQTSLGVIEPYRLPLICSICLSSGRGRWCGREDARAARDLPAATACGCSIAASARRDDSATSAAPCSPPSRRRVATTCRRAASCVYDESVANRRCFHRRTVCRSVLLMPHFPLFL